MIFERWLHAVAVGFDEVAAFDHGDVSNRGWADVTDRFSRFI